MVEASCVYEINMATDELVPIVEAWGLPPKYTLLDPKKVGNCGFHDFLFCSFRESYMSVSIELVLNLESFFLSFE